MVSYNIQAFLKAIRKTELKSDTKYRCPSQKLGRILDYLFVEKNFQNEFGFMVFFEKSFEKTQIFRVFYCSSLISQNRDQIQGPWFRIIYKRFVGYIFAEK